MSLWENAHSCCSVKLIRITIRTPQEKKHVLASKSFASPYFIALFKNRIGQSTKDWRKAIVTSANLNGRRTVFLVASILPPSATSTVWSCNVWCSVSRSFLKDCYLFGGISILPPSTTSVGRILQLHCVFGGVHPPSLCPRLLYLNSWSNCFEPHERALAQ